MNTVVIRRGLNRIAAGLSPGKLAAALGLIALLAAGGFGELVAGLLAEAYLQVSVFVAGTLGGLFLFERIRRADLERFLQRNRHLHIPVAAVFGALPGCGGALVITTQYVRGSISFGGMVAVLAATMGDAAFLLLAREPLVALAVFATCLVSGVLSGLIVDAIHGRAFLRVPESCDRGEEELVEEVELLSPLYKLWMLLFVPGAAVGIALAFQYDPAAALERWAGFDWVSTLAAFAALLSVFMWALNPLSDFRLYTERRRPLERRVADTTNFVTFWVIVGYVGYGLLEYAGFDIRPWLSAWAPALPLIALLIGFIPGCGPQIVVTSMYLSGHIPMSALLANAISNDGDALFPALAAAPRAALIATAYTAVPALVVGYGFFLLFE